MKNEIGRSLYGRLQKTLGGNVITLGGRPAKLGGQIKLLGDKQLDENGLIKIAQPAQVSALDVLRTAATSASLPTTLAPDSGTAAATGRRRAVVLALATVRVTAAATALATLVTSRTQ